MRDGLFLPFAPHHDTIQAGYLVMSDVRDKLVPVMAAPRRHSGTAHSLRTEPLMGSTEPRQSVHIGSVYVPRKVLATRSSPRRDFTASSIAAVIRF